MSSPSPGAIVISALVFFILVRELHEVVRRIDYSNLGAAPGSSLRITTFVASAISLGLVMCSCVAFMFPIIWQSVIVIAAAYVAWFLYLMKIAYDHTCMRSKYVTRPTQRLPRRLCRLTHGEGEIHTTICPKRPPIARMRTECDMGYQDNSRRHLIKRKWMGACATPPPLGPIGSGPCASSRCGRT